MWLEEILYSLYEPADDNMFLYIHALILSCCIYMPIHVHVKNNTHTHTHTNRPCLCGLAPERGSTFADVFVQGARCLREPACGICRHHTHTHAREHHIITVAFFRHHHHCHTYIHTHKIYQFLPPLGRKFRRLHGLFSTKFQRIIPL